MLRKMIFVAALGLSLVAGAQQKEAKMNAFVASLMKKMTLDEKIGQLNLLTPGGGIATGAVVNPDVESKIKTGKVGGLFGIIGVDKIKQAQERLINGKDTLPYRLLLPKNYDAKKEYPLILFLHGAGERGNDNVAQLTHGGMLFLSDSIRDKHPAIVVFPQCPANSYWSNVDIKFDSISKSRSFLFRENGDPTIAMKMVLKLLNELEDNYELDEDRFYVGGLSMGGMGTFELVRRKPKMFAAAFPICGGANAATASNLTKPNWWIFHGLKDNVVSPTFSQTMAGALKAAGANVRLTLYPEANHNSWDSAFAEKDLLPWLFSNHK